MPSLNKTDSTCIKKVPTHNLRLVKLLFTQREDRGLSEFMTNLIHESRIHETVSMTYILDVG